MDDVLDLLDVVVWLYWGYIFLGARKPPVTAAATTMAVLSTAIAAANIARMF